MPTYGPAGERRSWSLLRGLLCRNGGLDGWQRENGAVTPRAHLDLKRNVHFPFRPARYRKCRARGPGPGRGLKPKFAKSIPNGDIAEWNKDFMQIGTIAESHKAAADHATTSGSSHFGKSLLLPVVLRLCLLPRWPPDREAIRLLHSFLEFEDFERRCVSGHLPVIKLFV